MYKVQLLNFFSHVEQIVEEHGHKEEIEQIKSTSLSHVNFHLIFYFINFSFIFF